MIQLPFPPLTDTGRGGANAFDIRRYLYQVIDTLNRFLRDSESDGVRTTVNLSELPNLPAGNTGKGSAVIMGRDTDRYYVLIDSAGSMWTGTMIGGARTISWHEK